MRTRKEYNNIRGRRQKIKKMVKEKEEIVKAKENNV